MTGPDEQSTCQLAPDALAARRVWLQDAVFARAEESEALPDGRRWRFPAADDMFEALVALIRAERGCCSFLQMELTVTPGAGPLWLAIRGPAGAAPFIAATFGARPELPMTRNGAPAVEPDPAGRVGQA